MDEDSEFTLPEGVTDEKVEALIAAVGEACNQVGLYMNPHVEIHSGEGVMLMMAQFKVGKVAFLPRVQNPVQDKVDDQFKAIESHTIRETAKGIRERFEDPDEA